MKQKDIAILIAVAFMSAVFSLLLSNVFFSSPKDAQKVETVDAISADFPSPNKKYFNEKSVDPSKLVEIGNSSNQNPFGSGGGAAVPQ